MLRSRMKEVLGFTPRQHSGYRPRTQKELEDYDMSDNEWHDTENDRKFHRENKHEQLICLDFYNEKKNGSCKIPRPRRIRMDWNPIPHNNILGWG